MKNLMIVLALFFALTVYNLEAQRSTRSTETQTQTQTQTQEETATKTENRSGTQTATQQLADPKMKFDFKGYVVSLNSLVVGGSGKLTNEEAQKLVENGQPIGIMVNKKVFLVFNSDGSYAAKNLAKLASYNTIGIKGKRKTSGGISYILADDIKPIK